MYGTELVNGVDEDCRWKAKLYPSRYFFALTDVSYSDMLVITHLHSIMRSIYSLYE